MMRDDIIEILRHEIIGPTKNSDKKKQKELITQSPLIEYISGILEPQSGFADRSSEEIIDDNTQSEVQSREHNESGTDEGLSSTTTSQASLGYSFLIPKKGGTSYRIELNYGTYSKEETKEGYTRYRRKHNVFGCFTV